MSVIGATATISSAYGLAITPISWGEAEERWFGGLLGREGSGRAGESLMWGRYGWDGGGESAAARPSQKTIPRMSPVRNPIDTSLCFFGEWGHPRGCTAPVPTQAPSKGLVGKGFLKAKNTPFFLSWAKRGYFGPEVVVIMPAKLVHR